MYEPVDIVSAASSDEADFIAHAQDLIGEGGINSIVQAFDDLRLAGINPGDDAAQPVLIEALFQLLEAFEQDLGKPDTHLLILGFDPDFGEAACNLLLIANGLHDLDDLSGLGDGVVLLLAGLMAAAGQRRQGMDILEQAQVWRPTAPFQRAAVQLLLLVQENSAAVIDILFARIMDGRDHPEIWTALPVVIARFPDLTETISGFVGDELKFYVALWGVVHALCVAASGDVEGGLALLEPIATNHSQSTLAQGAFFHIKSSLAPADPALDLTQFFCTKPFETIDVLDGKSHLCCASWLPHSIGDLAEQSVDDVWNSEAAQSIRNSILDGSFRYCNKTACPQIAGNLLPLKANLVSESERWRDIITNYRTRLPILPHVVNLAYDETCNLSCPSCRTHVVAADEATRKRFDTLQEEKILPLLRNAELAFISGLGDPFASKNFRNLLNRLGPDDYPDLRFQIMTNGMLLTRREWARFPTLHGRVAYLRISIDAATGPTHELLRRGARWPVMEENLAFARELRTEGLIDRLELSFTVQVDNYQEMGQAVDLARHFGADHLAFTRMTNWGTFTPEEYAQKAVFMPSHPEHGRFVESMRDQRLRDDIVALNDLSGFVRATE
jgi:hypothetical protein